MKKVLSMVALGSMLFGLSACSSEEQEIEQATSGNVFVKLENVVGPSSRMTEPAKGDADVTEFHNGFLIFGTPKSAIRKHYQIVSSAKEEIKSDHVVLLDDLRKGKNFEGIPGDVTNVAIVANVTEEELSAAEFQNGTIRFHNDVLNHIIQLRNQHADNMSHVALYDMKTLQAGAVKGTMSASLELKPLCARLEIAKITPGPDVIEYQVDGDYDKKDPAAELQRFFSGYPYLANTDIKSVTETVGEGDEAKTVTAFYPEADGKVWAYPFFGKSELRNDDGHYGLRLIVKVSHLKVYLKDENGDKHPHDVTQDDKDKGIDEDKAGIRYLNINGFVEEYHNTEAEPVEFYNGNVYTVQNFEITTQNLSDRIMPTDINVNITVQVKPWTIKKVYPQI